MSPKLDTKALATAITAAANQFKQQMTTIAITVGHREELNAMKHGADSYDDVLGRLFANQVDVHTELISVDNELPQLHTLVLQLGDDTESLYFFNGKDFVPTTLDEANKKMKEPKPNLTINKEQTEIIYKNYLHIIRAGGTATPAEETLHAQLKLFLGVE